MRRIGLFVCVLAVSLLAAACGDEDMPTAPTPPPAPAPAPAPPPPPAAPAVLEGVSFPSYEVRGQERPTGTIHLSAAAPTGGAVVKLESLNEDVVKVPATVTVPAGQQTADFTADIGTIGATISVELVAQYDGVAKVVSLRVSPPMLQALVNVSSPSQGQGACSIVNNNGGVDCVFDASQSPGFPTVFQWTYRVGGNSTTFDAGATVTPGTTCATLAGGSVSDGAISMEVSVLVVDRNDNKAESQKQGVRIVTNGRCGY